MHALKRLGVAILFGVLTVGGTIGFSEYAWAFLNILGREIAFYHGHQITVVAAVVASMASLLPAAFDRGLWWVGKVSTFILAASLIIAPVTFVVLGYRADKSAFNQERLDVIFYFGLPVAFGFGAALVVMLLYAIAALARHLIERRRRQTPDPASAFD